MRREKKYLANRLEGKKFPAHQVARKKILLTRNHVKAWEWDFDQL